MRFRLQLCLFTVFISLSLGSSVNEHEEVMLRFNFH